MRSVYEQTGIMPEDLEAIELPPILVYLLGYFQQLSSARQCGMSLNPLSFSEIDAWSRLYHLSLETWEIDVIKQLDLIYLNVNSEA